MVTKMAKLSVLLYHGEREYFLNKLRELGVVHIEKADKELDKNSAALNSQLLEVEKVISEIKRIAAAEKEISGKCDLSAEQAVKKMMENTARIEAINNEISAISKEKVRFEPWGDVSPETLNKLKEKNVHISLYELSVKDKPLLENLTYEVIKEISGYMYIAIVDLIKPVAIEGKEPWILPDTTLAELNRKESLLNAERHKLTDEQKSITLLAAEIEKYKNDIQNQLNFEIASSSMESAANEKLLSVNGWVPVEKQAEIQKTLDEFSCWYEFENPTQKDDVPVQYNNSKFASKYEVITNLFSLPKYTEIDPTPFFAPFYMLFFGFCMGDVGYGLLIFFGGMIAYFKVGDKMRPITSLIMMLGFATIIGGFLLNGFFGMSIFDSADGAGLLGTGGGLSVWSFLKATEVHTETGMASIMPMIPFSLFLGIFQILFGIILKIVNKLRQNGGNIKYALYPLGTMFLTVAATLWVTQINFLDMGSFFEVITGGSVTAADVAVMITPTTIMVPLVIGLVLLFLFNNPSKPLWVRLPSGIWELYQYITGIMGDVLSYIRLFALGLAGGLLGASFNKIALMITGGELDFSTPLVIFTILILIFGHAINIALSALGAFVHPLRLTFVEFYKYMEFEGGAREYKPFTKVE